MKKIISLFLLSGICFTSYAQRGSIGFILPRDKVKLKNGDAETGKIIFIDSTKITLQKYDYSERTIQRKDIDTITGLSYFTYFVAPSFGYLKWNGLINQRLDTFTREAAHINVRLGVMRRKHVALSAELAYQLGNSFKLFHLGGGVRFYIFSNYVKKKNVYFEINAGYNIPQVNINRFMDVGWNLGYEYLIKEKYRAFAELYRTHEQKYTPKPAAFGIQFGMRFSIEYGNYYKKMNMK